MRHNTFLFIPLILLLAACGTSREYAYISDAERDSAQAIIGTFASTVHPGDQLYIYVSSQTPESVIPFNEETNKLSSGLVSENTVDGYRVSQSGMITFPVLGTFPAAGKTRDSLAHDIEERLRDGGYVNDPIVTVSLMNFRVAVVGEVAQPQELHVSGERLTIFEALAMCGDITIHGHRENVTVIRQSANPNDTTRLSIQDTSRFPALSIGKIDLTAKTLFDSPYYYLHQGDIVYVEPDNKQKHLATRDPNIPAYTSLTVSAANLLVRLYSIFVNPQRRGW